MRLKLPPERACTQAAARLSDALTSVPGGLDLFLREGPHGHPQFAMLAPDVRALGSGGAPDSATTEGQAAFRMLVDRIRGYFLTQDGAPRKARGFGSSEFKKEQCTSEPAWKRLIAVTFASSSTSSPSRPNRSLSRTRIVPENTRAYAIFSPAVPRSTLKTLAETEPSASPTDEGNCSAIPAISASTPAPVMAESHEPLMWATSDQFPQPHVA